VLAGPRGIVGAKACAAHLEEAARGVGPRGASGTLGAASPDGQHFPVAVSEPRAGFPRPKNGLHSRSARGHIKPASQAALFCLWLPKIRNCCFHKGRVAVHSHGVLR